MRWSSQMMLGGAGSLMVVLTACAAAPEPSAEAREGPAWFAQAREAAIARGYPNLADVPVAPRARPASDPSWDAVTAELVADRAALEASERASPAPADAGAQADAFRDEAVRAIEQTRERY